MPALALLAVNLLNSHVVCKSVQQVDILYLSNKDPSNSRNAFLENNNLENSLKNQNFNSKSAMHSSKMIIRKIRYTVELR